VRQIIREAKCRREEFIKEQEESEEIMGLYGQYFYEEQGINALSAVETIYKLCEDIGRNGMKFFEERHD
jgi:hypothetical protein